MKNKKLKLIYVIFSIAVLFLTVIIFILGRTETISGNITYIAVTLLIILWICISRVIRDKQEASLPKITEEAILTEKTQDNRHSYSA